MPPIRGITLSGYEKGKIMLRKTLLTALALMVGAIFGHALSRTPVLGTAHAQEVVQILVKGSGRAITSVKPLASEHFTLVAANAPRRSFKVVPAGKKLIVTDVMYITQQSVRQNIVVNLANANPARQKQDILLQVALSPGESDDLHLCSGYVIPAGNALVAFTNANLEPDQYVSVSVTGYLADE